MQPQHGADLDRRARLRALGWVQEDAPTPGVPQWRSPDDGATVEEEEAFATLDRVEIAEAR